MNSQEAFGIRLRRARQHRGVSLDDIASRTNVKVELWEDLERSDLARWPGGLYARTWIRAYAESIGLDPDQTVDDFCRWFLQGDRRTETDLRKHAEIVGHQLDWRDDLSPVGGDRRAPRPDAPNEGTTGAGLRLRLIAAACDLGLVSVLAIVATAVLPTGASSHIGIVALLYYAVSVATLGCTPAVWALDTWLRERSRLDRGTATLTFRRLRPARKQGVPMRRGAMP